MTHILGAVASVALLLWAMVKEPTRFQCPGVRDVWLMQGVDRSGIVRCYYSKRHGGEDWQVLDPYMLIQSRVYCTGGTVPIVVDHRTVGCQRASSDSRE